MDVKDLALYDEQLSSHIEARMFNLRKLIGRRVRILKGKFKGRIGEVTGISYGPDIVGTSFLYLVAPVSLKDGKLLIDEARYARHQLYDWSVHASAPYKVISPPTS